MLVHSQDKELQNTKNESDSFDIKVKTLKMDKYYIIHNPIQSVSSSSNCKIDQEYHFQNIINDCIWSDVENDSCD